MYLEVLEKKGIIANNCSSQGLPRLSIKFKLIVPLRHDLPGEPFAAEPRGRPHDGRSLHGPRSGRQPDY